MPPFPAVGPDGAAGRSSVLFRPGRRRVRLDSVNVADLAEILSSAPLDPRGYHLLGSSDEGLCLLPEGQTWNVFVSERGARHEEHSFHKEDDACVYFLKRVFQLQRGR
jgi:hypothetical protein